MAVRGSETEVPCWKERHVIVKRVMKHLVPSKLGDFFSSCRFTRFS